MTKLNRVNFDFKLFLRDIIVSEAYSHLSLSIETTDHHICSKNVKSFCEQLKFVVSFIPDLYRLASAEHFVVFSESSDISFRSG